MLHISAIGDAPLLRAFSAWEIEGASALSRIAKQAIQTVSNFFFQNFFMAANYIATLFASASPMLKNLRHIKNRKQIGMCRAA